MQDQPISTTVPDLGAAAAVEELPDILAHDLAVIFVGINPGRTAAVAGRHFVSRSNRFWRVLHQAGFTPQQIDPQHDHTILDYGYGLTTAVARPTRRAGELSRAELLHAAPALERKLAALRPRTVAFLGKPAYAAVLGNAHVTWGPQAARFAGASAWVLPNPSGLNRNFSLAALVSAYTALRSAISAGSRAAQRRRAVTRSVRR
jgi:TDG/mug DNA glycosylase family protein